jgi:hypothetical protein
MKCDEAAEYVSALCDGVTIPRAAAEHINACESCRRRLKEYVEVGTELRRLASLEIAEVQPPIAWPKRRQGQSIPWLRGRKTVRMPRLALASLMVAIVVLASGWALTGVRANSGGSVLLVQYSLGNNVTRFCALSSADRKFNKCTLFQSAESGQIAWQIELLSKKGDQATLGVRAKFIPQDQVDQAVQAFIEHNDLPQRQFSFTPGETLHVNVNGIGPVSITGQWINHIPAIQSGTVGDNQELDPGPQELRIISPLLLRGKQVIGDFQGFSTTVTGHRWEIFVFVKGVGRFTVALSPLPGAVQGKVDFNRISFALDGTHYAFVSGAPITRSRTVWVLYDPNPSTRTIFGSVRIDNSLSGRG